MVSGGARQRTSGVRQGRAAPTSFGPRTEQLAEVLGISRRSVYRLAQEGAIPHYRFKGQLRFRLSEVLDATRGDREPPER